MAAHETRPTDAAWQETHRALEQRRALRAKQQAALAELGMSGNAYDLPNDLRRLALAVADLTREVREISGGRRRLGARIRAAVRRAID